MAGTERGIAGCHPERPEGSHTHLGGQHRDSFWLGWLGIIWGPGRKTALL